LLCYNSDRKSSTDCLGYEFILDFSQDFCHHRKAMQKVEKWRIQELGQVLSRLSRLLRQGENSEWANVFFHFAQEAQNLVDHKRFDLNVLKRLVQNIINCFDGISSMGSLVLIQENANKMDLLNQEFRDSIKFLFEILASIKAKWTESVN
jgi:hypothetical protein